MKRLLFLFVCALLLLGAAAAPVAARDTYPTPAYPPYWYGASVMGPYTWWVDETTHTAGLLDRPTFPAGYPVYVGETWYCCTYGQSIRQAAALQQRLEVWTYDRAGSKVVLVSVDESTSQDRWVGPYDVNASYSHDYTAYRPQVQSGFWGMDWMIALGPLAKGTYFYSYSDKQDHWVSDPLFDATPYHYEPHDWIDHGTYSFKVR
jgi:hypothetical protein